jgi:hypothetical protein
MTEPSLDAIRSLRAAITPPWHLDENGGWEEEHGLRFLAVLGGGVPGSMEEHCIANVSNYGQGEDACEADAAFIAAAPAIVDWLMARMEMISPEKLRSIAKFLDLMDVLMSRIRVGDMPGDKMFAELKGTEMQEDLRKWADVLEDPT